MVNPASGVRFSLFDTVVTALEGVTATAPTPAPAPTPQAQPQPAPARAEPAPRTTAIAPAATVKPKKPEILFVGMGEHSRAEADSVRTVASMPVKFIGRADESDKITVKVGNANKTYDLSDDTGIQDFLDTAFTPALSSEQKSLVKDAFASSYGHGRDEIALTALEFAKAQAPGGGVKIQHLMMSGHSYGGVLWGDNNGHFDNASIERIVQAFPETAKQVESVYFSACNHFHASDVETLRGWFPNLKFAGGYNEHAPGTWVGAASQAKAWIDVINDGRSHIEPSHLRAKLSAYKASATKQDTDYYAMNESEHLATWNKDDSKFRYYKEENGKRVPTAEVVTVDTEKVRQNEATLDRLQGDLDGILAGTGATELSTVKSDDSGTVGQFYIAAQALVGTVGLNAAQRAKAERAVKLGVAARFYVQIVDRFQSANATLISEASEEGSRRGFSVKSGAELKKLTRKQMLDYIAALKAAAPSGSKMEALAKQLDEKIGRLENVPSAWL